MVQRTRAVSRFETNLYNRSRNALSFVCNAIWFINVLSSASLRLSRHQILMLCCLIGLGRAEEQDMESNAI